MVRAGHNRHRLRHVQVTGGYGKQMEESEMATTPSPGADNVPVLDQRAAARAFHAGTATFVDVREPEEWDEGHIPGALHIPLAELPDRLHELPADSDVILVCRSGARSFAATEFLLRNGHARAVNLDGGMLAWLEANHPVAT